MSKLHDRKIKEHHLKHEEANMASSLNRARSISVGTCFGGMTEVMMRANDGSVLWAPMHPNEVIEFIHQLAANVGCHIAIKPRQDFSSWRNWNVNETESLGHFETPVKSLRTPDSTIRSESNEQTVATQKTVGRKRTKRAAAAA